MTVRDLALESLERAINTVLSLDPDATRRLGRLHGKSIRVDLRGTGIQLDFVPGHDGRLQLVGRVEGKPEATLSGTPFDLLRASDARHGHAQLFGGRVRIDGNSATAQQFSAALAGLDVDWEEHLSRLTGDIAAHEIGRAVRSARREGERVTRSARDNLSEYLTEEVRVLPHGLEVDDYLSDVDRLRDDAARLEARIARLENTADEDKQ